MYNNNGVRVAVEGKAVSCLGIAYGMKVINNASPLYRKRYRRVLSILQKVLAPVVENRSRRVVCSSVPGFFGDTRVIIIITVVADTNAIPRRV